MSAVGRPRGAMVRRISGASSLRLALLQVAIMTLVLAALEVALFFDGPVRPVWVLVLFAAVGVEYVLAGLLAWARRPSNRTGTVLCIGGLSLLLSGLQNTDISILVAVGLVMAEVPIAVILHILLAFPSGRLRGVPACALVIAGYAITVVLQAPSYLFSNVTGLTGVLHVATNSELVHVGTWIQRSTGAIVIVLTALVLARRLRAATRPQRRVLAIVYPYGIAAILFLEVAVNVLPPLFGLGPVTVFVLQILAAAGIPVAFVVGMLRGGFARVGEIEELGMWLGAERGGQVQLQEALAATLGDESLQLVLWLPEVCRYVDARGASVQLPDAGSDRAAVEVDAGGACVGAITYNALLIAEPELVRMAGRVIALALERERLTAQLLSSQQALSDSRARIVRAADQERRRIARDLHDGLQAQLVLLAMKVGQVAADPAAGTLRGEALQVRSGLERASDELRRIVQGLMPVLLIERGLYAATEDLVDRMPVPTRLELPRPDHVLPGGVEWTAYSVVAEALTNAVKHSRARQMAVTLARSNGKLRIEVRDDGVGGARPGDGIGLRGIADRLDVVGGGLWVDSPPGGGTLLRAEVPCES